MTPDLPPELKSALDRAAFGVSRTEAAARAASISRTYRSGGNSHAIVAAGDALAYAFTRMPATFAAVAACLEAVRRTLPDFAPASLLDVGAGPGTATWAATEAFLGLMEFTLVDANPALRSLALQLMDKSPRLQQALYRLGEARTELVALPQHDIVIASYVAAELAAADASAIVERMWAKTSGLLLIVEPGTPDGYRRVLDARARLIALGGHVVAPCPHDAACPLTPPDWCHFSQRLSRSRDHKQIKQADVPFEDEKYAYVAVSRTCPARRAARVLAPPVVNKVAVHAKVCTPDGVIEAVVPRRDKTDYARARRLRWGDAVPDTETGKLPEKPASDRARGSRGTGA